MFKFKINSKLSKCIKITGNGKILRKMCGKNHKLNKKSNSRKRRLDKKCIINKSTLKNVRKSLGL